MAGRLRWLLRFGWAPLAGACAAAPGPPVEADAGAAPARSAPARTSAPGSSGGAQPAAGAATAGIVGARVFVLAEPRADAPEIGVLRLGSVVRLREAPPRPGPGCEGEYRAVAPAGWVCVSPRTATLDPEHDLVLAARRAYPTDFDRDAPFAWGESVGAPLYRKLPDAAEQRRAEPDLARHLARAAQLRDALTRGDDAEVQRLTARLGGVAVERASETPPPWLQGGAVAPLAALLAPDDPRARDGSVPRRSSVAWIAELWAGDRTWLVTPELYVVPADRIVRQPPSSFAGVRLAGGVQLPLAFVRAERADALHLTGELAPTAQPVAYRDAARPSDARDEDRPALVEDARGSTGRLEPAGSAWPRLAALPLTGRARWQRGERYLETRRDGAWVRERDVTVATREAARGLPLAPGERWLDVSIHRGTLVAYQGDTPVFATLVSPGLFGYRRVDGKPARYTTPTGAFRIEWKHRSTTMSPDPERRSYFLAEVPWTQFFHMPFALHAAYWHDRFGEPKSGGCVNLSVADARWLFAWTSPAVPAGWHGVRAGGDRGEGTWVQVR
ncbi:MAG: L,D-transpeptidase [Polyangiaceae bacterium]|nr:L,D-transpeptidase [Polyangiaceae bacterium]